MLASRHRARLLLSFTGLKLTDSLPTGSVDASLIAEVDSGAGHPAGHRNVHLLVLTVDDRLAELCAHLVRSREVTDILRGEVGIEPGDEYCGTHDFGEAGRVVRQRVAGWSDIRCIQLKRLCAREISAAGLGGGSGADSADLAATGLLCLGASDYACQQECRLLKLA